MALLHLSSQPISLGPEAFLHACFLPIGDRWSGDAKAEVPLILGVS